MPTKIRTVLVFGDSNTHGSPPKELPDGSNRYEYENRWPTHLARCLGADWQVIPEGHPGRTTVHNDPIEGAHKNGIAALPAILETHRPLDLVIIMLGTNDLKMRFSLPASDIAKSNEKLIEMIRANGCGTAPGGPDILLIAPPVILEAGRLASMFTGGRAKSEQLADLYADVAENQKVGFLDASQHIVSSPIDGIHFEVEEHQKLGEAVAKTVLAMM